MARKKRFTTDAVEILDRLFVKNDPKILASIEEERIKSEIGRIAYDLREEASLTHGQLGKRIGVKASVIDDLENADYDRQPLALLQRIATSLGKRVEIRVASAKKSRRTA